MPATSSERLWLRAWQTVWGSANRSVATNASTWIGTTVVTSGLGFGYWWLAARLFPPAAVGFAAASVSAMLLLGTLSVLGLGTLLIGEIPRHPGREGALVVTALVPAGLAGWTLGVAFAVGAPLLVPDLAPLAADPGSVALFGLGVSLTTIGLVVDQACLGLLRGDVQLARNTAFAIVKLGLLGLAGLWLVDVPPMTIYATWVVGSLASLLGLAALVARKRGTWDDYWPEWALLRQVSGAALAHHALNLALQAPQLALPVVVAAQFSTTLTAYFYVAWMIAGLVYMGPVALTTAVYAAGARAPAALAARLQFSLGLSAAGSVLAVIGLLVAAAPVLRLFGAAYAEEAAACLQVLAIGVLPLLVRDHYVAICRVRGRLVRAAVIAAAISALGITAAVLGAGMGGLTGLAAGYVLAAAIPAALLAPSVLQGAFPRRPR